MLDEQQCLLLTWLAQEVAGGRITPDRLPISGDMPAQYRSTALTLRELEGQAQRWAQLLFLIGQRSDPCAVQLARALQAEGFPLRAVQSAVAHVKPALASRNDLRGRPDGEYVKWELEDLTRPTYESKVRLAYATLPHDPQLAERTALSAFDLDAARWEANLCLAETYQQFGKHTQAHSHYQQAINKGCTTCHLQLIRSANKAGSWQLALDVVDKMLNPDGEALLERARAIRGLRGPAPGLDEYGRLDLTTLRPASRAEAVAEMAQCALELGQTKRALELTRQRGMSGGRSAQRVRAMALRQERRWSEAVNALRQYVAVAPEDSEAFGALAHAQYMTGDLRGAAQSGQRALEINQRDVDAACITIQALVALQEYEAAVRIGTPLEFVGVPPSSVARLMIGTRRLEQAADFIRDWIESRPEEADAHLCMGWLCETMGRPRDALENYGHALRLAPDSRWVQTQIDYLTDAIEYGELGAEE